MVNHFINFKQFKPDYLENLITLAQDVKRDPAFYAGRLSGKKMYMLFQKTSTRTALSFALGMTGLGGEYFLQKWEDSNFMVGEIRDEVRYVARHVDVIMARLKNNRDINLMAEYSPVPVINGCCDKYHPCQAMADLLTIQELHGDFKVKLLYIGVRNNVLNSLMDSLPRLGGELWAVAPVINRPSVDEELYQSALKTGRFHLVGDGYPTLSQVKKVLKEVDIVYTDTWVDMEFVNDPSYEKEKKERIKKMLPFQVNSELLQGNRAVVMHDMPIHAGYEISRDVVEQNIGTILQQAENRKYAQQAVLLSLLENS